MPKAHQEVQPCHQLHRRQLRIARQSAVAVSHQPFRSRSRRPSARLRVSLRQLLQPYRAEVQCAVAMHNSLCQWQALKLGSARLTYLSGERALPQLRRLAAATVLQRPAA